jgi:Arc/MetJ-type ribon-helix-helix transcriptional regulator
MRNEPQTLIGVIRSAVNSWRKSQDWSRETAAQQIVEAHEAIGAHQVTGITFDLPGRDAFARAKVWGERIFRWLDDETKDSTLLPANLLPSVLAALPMDQRLHCLNEMFGALGVEVRSADAPMPGEFDASGHLRTMIKESSEAQMALLTAGSNPSPEVLRAALKEVRDEREAATSTERAIEAALAEAEPKLAAIPIRAST